MNPRLLSIRLAAAALLVVLIAVLAAPVGAVPTCTTDCYVSPTGNDANDGASAATPLLTIQLAVNTLTSGGTVHLAAGTYTQDTFINKSLTLDGGDRTTTFIDPTNIGLDISADDVTITNVTLLNAGIHGARIQDVGGTVLNTTFDTVNFTTNASRGLEIATAATNVVVDNCVFDGNLTGIRSSSTAVVTGLDLLNSTFKNHTNTSSGIGYYQASDGNPGNVSDLRVDNSLFENNGFAALYGEEMRDVIVEDSTFQNNYRAFLLFDAYTGSFTATGPFLFQNNTFTNHRNAAILFQINANALGFPATFQDNTFNQDAAIATSNTTQIFIVLHDAFTHAAVNILDNDITFSGTYGGGATSLYGIRLIGGSDAIEIHDNTINGGNIGANGGTPATAGLYIVSDRATFGGPKATSVINVTGNVITGFPNGVVIRDEVTAVYGNLPAGAQLAINRNDLSANSLFGIQSGVGEDTDAVCNWWGAADGPGPVGPGSGSNVTSDVIYAPWLVNDILDSPCFSNVYVSAFRAGVTDDALAFGPHDVLEWDGTAWSLWFDGTAAGLTPNGRNKHNLAGFWFPDAAGEDVVLAFVQNSRFVPGITGKVDGMDLVWWDGSAFSLFFDGQDVGLTNKTNEKIDALHVLDGSESPVGGGCLNYLLISTQGAGQVPGMGGPIKFGGEDVLGFCMTNTGAATTGVWHKLLDGSNEGVPKNAINGLSFSDDGDTMYLTTHGAFNVDTATGTHSMIYQYNFVSGEFSGPFWVAADAGLHEKVNGMQAEPAVVIIP